jgi:zinc protease
MTPGHLGRLTTAAIAGLMVLASGYAPSSSLSAAVRPPKLQYEVVNLSNGLTVVLSEDHSTPIVHLQMWYHVGSKNEKPGRTGFAHLFEHLMFKGSQNVEPESHTSIVSSVGGQSNAYTTDDETVFWETVPSQYLPAVLWLEADRMATLRIDRNSFVNEREVVKEERRMRIDNQPYGRLSEIIYDQAFTVHPYKHPTIGSMQDLEAARWPTRFLRHLLRAGECDRGPGRGFRSGEAKAPSAATLAAWRPRGRCRATFGRSRRRRRNVASRSSAMAAAGGGGRLSHHLRRPSRLYPLHIASKVLSDGQSSRIYRLSTKRQLAVAAFGSANLIEDPNLFYAVASSSGNNPVEAIDALIGSSPPQGRSDYPAELQRTKNQFARLPSDANQTSRKRCSSAMVIIDIRRPTAVDIFQNLTVADVQRVANTYFAPDNRLVITHAVRTPGPGFAMNGSRASVRRVAQPGARRVRAVAEGAAARSARCAR